MTSYKPITNLITRLLIAGSFHLPILAAATPADKTVNADRPSARDLLKETDRARGTADTGLSWNVTLESFDDDLKNKVDYKIKVKGNNAIAEAISPARNKGDVILFNDRTMWFYKTGNKKPVAISPRQKLAGEAANGDIASTNYYRDYEASIVGEEKINGKDTWKLELKAKSKNVTYDAIRYFVSKKEHLGIRAEFLTISGEVFKIATVEYENTLSNNGQKYAFVSKMTIASAINNKSKSILTYAAVKIEPLDDSIFNVNNLVR